MEDSDTEIMEGLTPGSHTMLIVNFRKFIVFSQFCKKAKLKVINNLS